MEPPVANALPPAAILMLPESILLDPVLIDTLPLDPVVAAPLWSEIAPLDRPLPVAKLISPLV